MELNKCSCGATPEIIINRNPYESNGCYIGKVICRNCKAQTLKYGLLSTNEDFLIKRWNEGSIYFIDEFRDII